MTSCAVRSLFPKAPKGITYRSVWWRTCDTSCPSLSCGSQMRRKAEVLRHVNNRNQLTKKQQYSRLIQYGRTIKVRTDTQRKEQIEALRRRFSQVTNGRYPAYYSNVPGRRELFLDIGVPLVNFRNVKRSPCATQRLRLERPPPLLSQ